MRISILLALSACLAAGGPRKEKPSTAPAPAPVLPPASPASPGSIYSSDGRLADLGRDFRARQVGDIVSLLVSERANASARGTTSATRKSDLNASIPALAGSRVANAALNNLAGMSGNTKMQGQGETSRATELTTTLSTRVVEVLPNGDLIVAGSREVWINSERQLVTVRGIVRANDLSSGNRVQSERLADLSVHIQGKGVVQDAVRRPNFLYRLLMGLLPF